MSTPIPPSDVGTTVIVPGNSNREIKLISHSNLFYWWPVWVAGFFMAGWTSVENTRMTSIPHNATMRTGIPEEKAKTYIIKTEQADLPRLSARAVNVGDKNLPEEPFPTHMSQHAWLGSLFVLILILVIIITNVPMRGLWSFLVIILFVVIALFVTVFHGWDEIFERVTNLRIYINLAGYLTIATAILFIWCIATFIFDRRTYVIFTPGQIKVCEHIGASVRTFDTVGVTFEKQRDDLFRHYILGFGSGDLILRTAGADRHEIKMPNVLGIGWQLQAVENMLRERSMTTS